MENTELKSKVLVEAVADLTYELFGKKADKEQEMPKIREALADCRAEDLTIVLANLQALDKVKGTSEGAVLIAMMSMNF